MLMPDDLNQFRGLLDDPVEEPEVVEEPVDPTDEIPLIPDQPSDDNPPVTNDGEQPDPDENNNNNDDDDVLTSYLKSRGIKDPTKLQFENDEGGIDERDFNSLSKDEQLTILKELASSEYTDYEKEVINYLRVNNTDLQGVINYFQNKAIEDYLAQNPEAAHQKSYSIDDYSDDELYIADLAARFPDFTEEELNAKLESAKMNEDVFKKEVDSLRTFYKGEEDRQAEAAKQKEQEDYQNLQNTLLNTLNGFNEVVLDATDPQSDSLEIEDSDKQAMLQYLLEQDKDGQSQFDKDLSDPAALIEIAWLRTQGRNTISGLTQYWKKELADTRKELANVKKQLEKYQNKDNGTNVVVKPRAPKEKPKTVNELWDMYN